MKQFLLIISVFLFSATSITAQKTGLDYYMPEGVTFDKSIPTPEQVLGAEVGEWHVRHDQLVNYMYAVAEASDRVTITEYARSYENRPFLMLTITSPQNHRNIDKIKNEHVQLTNPDKSANLDTSKMPVVVSLHYSIHGNEPSGTNASMLVVYYLAAAQGREINQMLENTVILVDPSINPDGLNRFASWANTHRSLNVAVTDPNSREFNEMWPGGRTNHYWFDLNRDWLPVQHPGSRARIGKFHEWKPNILNDHHEMGTNSTYFFQPGIPSRTHPLTPDKNQALTEAIAEFHADEFDKSQNLYYTKESFDDFYYGKGSTYPDVNGSVGILYEQASSRGHAQESVHGIITFPFTIRNHFKTSLSTLKAAQALREDLLMHMRDFYLEKAELAKTASIKAYVFGDEKDQARTFHLADIIKQHDIKIYELDRDVQFNGDTFEKGKSYIIPTNQPQYQLITAIFERRTEFTDSLFYDVSAWTLPYAFNLPFAELTAREYSNNILGKEFDGQLKNTGKLMGGRSDYAYAFEWNEYYAPRSLYRLLNNGVRTKVASIPFTAVTPTGTKEFGYGTILVPLGIQDNQEQVHQLIEQAAKDENLTIYNISSGLAATGVDLGSNSFANLRKPEVMMISGPGTNSSEIGEVWHLFDQRYHMPLSIVEQQRVNGSMLDRYNVVVVSGFSYRDLSDNAVEELKRWVSNGGTLIAYKQGVSWAKQQGLANVDFISTRMDNSNSDSRPYVKQSSDSGAQVIGGAIFNVKLDLTHPLAYGYSKENIRVLRNSTLFMEKGKNIYSTPMVYTDKPLASGYISDRNQELLAGTAGVVVSRHGRGKVISMTDNPNFRAFWFGTNKLFMNAVFFGHTISSSTAN